MDIRKLEARIDRGEQFRVTYLYPTGENHPGFGDVYKTRTDRLLAVEPSNGRIFVSFRDRTPIWIEGHEIVGIEPAM